MKILIACECSGIVRDSFAARGHDAWSCDLKPCEKRNETHWCGNVETLLEMETHENKNWAKGWDFIGAHPECRYLTVSGMHWTTRGLRDPKLTTDAIAFVETLWTAIKRCKYGYLENSIGVLPTRSTLGKPTQIIQPYQFGHDASKATCLWLHNLPPLKPTKFIEPRMVCACKGVYKYGLRDCPHCGAESGMAKPRWGNQTDSGQNRLGPSATRSADRARTYQGIADAMAAQWGNL